MTRNSNQTTRHSPPGGVDGWAQDYAQLAISRFSNLEAVFTEIRIFPDSLVFNP